MIKALAASLLALPAVGVLLLLGLNFFSLAYREVWIERITRTIMVLAGAVALLLTWSKGFNEQTVLQFGDWLTLPSTRFSISLILDPLSLSYLMTSGFIAAVVGYFSARYLHRDPGFLRFFTLYLLFVTGLNATILAGNLVLLIIGWELVGLSSVLLVGFYHERQGPRDGSRIVFSAYRLGDIGLHGLTACLPILIGSDQLFDLGNVAHGAEAPSLILICSLLFLLAAAAKSAQGPFAIWLPRAMEGPTPSSAIFYGALSVHLGAYLLLRTSPIWRQVPVMPWLIMALGGLTALYGASVGRTRTDIKSMLAYASMAQVGLIFVEISLGWDQLAIWHMAGHAMVRTLQFLRSPSAIADWIRFGRRQGWRAGDRPPLEARLGNQGEKWLFSKAFFGWGLEQAIQKTLIDPCQWAGTKLDLGARRLASSIDKQMSDTTTRCPEYSFFDGSSEQKSSAQIFILSLNLAYGGIGLFALNPSSLALVVGWMLSLIPIFVYNPTKAVTHRIPKSFLIAQSLGVLALITGLSIFELDSRHIVSHAPIPYLTYAAQAMLILAVILRHGFFPANFLHISWHERGPLALQMYFATAPLGPILIARHAVFQGIKTHEHEFYPLAWLLVSGLIVYGLIALVQKTLRYWNGLAQQFLLTLASLFSLHSGTESADGVRVLLVACVLIGISFTYLLWLIEDRLGPEDSYKVGGLAQVVPLLSSVLLLFGLALVGLPGTLGFVTEDVWLHLSHQFPSVAIVAMILSYVALGIGFYRVYSQRMFGPAELPATCFDPRFKTVPRWLIW
jgi:NAD(P)H-quinone oxidoreductase subunit 5